MHLVPNVRAFVHSMPTRIGGDVVLRAHGLGLSHATGIASRNTGVLSKYEPDRFVCTLGV